MVTRGCQAESCQRIGTASCRSVAWFILMRIAGLVTKQSVYHSNCRCDWICGDVTPGVGAGDGRHRQPDGCHKDFDRSTVTVGCIDVLIGLEPTFEEALGNRPFIAAGALGAVDEAGDIGGSKSVWQRGDV